MKQIFFVATSCFLLTLFSCTKEDDISMDPVEVILNQSVSGNVMIDENNDLEGDTPLEGARIYMGDFELINEILGQRPDTLPAPYNEIPWADTDADGNYIMNGVLPVEDKILMLYSPVSTELVIGFDKTPDGDFLEEDQVSIINITVEMDEHDDGNDFIVQLTDTSCKISGFVHLDTDGDGIQDSPALDMRMLLSRANELGDPISGTTSIDMVTTDNNGYYEFSNVEPGDYVVLFGAAESHHLISSGDESPDSDLAMGSNHHWIPVSVITDEHDSDNNFLARLRVVNVQGNVLIDNNGDNVGDEPAVGQRVELYRRTDTGVPTTPLVRATNSNQNGEFKFTDLEAGEHVLYFIGNGDYTCISGADLSPEAGEPTSSPEVFFIPVNIPDSDFLDEDNTFVVVVN